MKKVHRKASSAEKISGRTARRRVAVQAPLGRRASVPGTRSRLLESVRHLSDRDVAALLPLARELTKREPTEPLAFVIVPDLKGALKSAATRLRSLTDRQPAATIPVAERRLLRDVFEPPDLNLDRLATQNQERVLEHRRALLADTLSTEEVRQALHLGTRQAIAARAKQRELCAIRNGRELRFPKWQFEDSQANGVVAGLPDVLRAATQLSDVEVASWLSRPQRAFRGRTPVEVLRAGGVDRVLKAVRGVGVT